jgi:hypothetical protein
LPRDSCFDIREGAVDGTDLAGCKAVLIADTPKVMTDGNWRVGIFVNDDATDRSSTSSSGSVPPPAAVSTV